MAFESRPSAWADLVQRDAPLRFGVGQDHFAHLAAMRSAAKELICSVARKAYAFRAVLGTATAASAGAIGVGAQPAICAPDRPIS
jgi:hypothetical protein